MYFKSFPDGEGFRMGLSFPCHSERIMEYRQTNKFTELSLSNNKNSKNIGNFAISNLFFNFRKSIGNYYENFYTLFSFLFNSLFK